MEAYDADVKHALFVLIPEGQSGEVHSTLLYMGDPIGAPPSMMLCQVGQAMARFTQPPVGFVMRHDTMADGTQAALLDGPQINALYENLQVWAKSQWGYSPHISVQLGHALPSVGTMVTFDRLALWYGEERWSWRIGTGEPCAT